MENEIARHYVKALEELIQKFVEIQQKKFEMKGRNKEGFDWKGDDYFFEKNQQREDEQKSHNNEAEELMTNVINGSYKSKSNFHNYILQMFAQKDVIKTWDDFVKHVETQQQTTWQQFTENKEQTKISKDI